MASQRHFGFRQNAKENNDANAIWHYGDNALCWKLHEMPVLCEGMLLPVSCRTGLRQGFARNSYISAYALI
jgi:hypothetical protein